MISRILSLLAALGLIAATTASVAPAGEAKTLHLAMNHPLQDGGGGSSGGGSIDGQPPGGNAPVPHPW